MEERRFFSHRRVASLPLALLAAVFLAAPAAGQQSPATPPFFWDVRETRPRPDVAALPRLRFLVTTDFRPFNFLDGQGRLTGYHVDLARAICAELGILERCEIQALPWEELEPALRRGDGEAILAGIAITPETRQRLGFTRTYMRFPARFVAQRTTDLAEPLAASIQGRRIGVVSDTVHERLLRERFGVADPVGFDDQAEMLDALAAGRLDAAFGDGLRLADWLGTSPDAACCSFAGGPYLAPDHLGHGLAIAVKPDDATLRGALDWGLQQTAAKGKIAELYLRYFPVGFF